MVSVLDLRTELNWTLFVLNMQEPILSNTALGIHVRVGKNRTGEGRGVPLNSIKKILPCTRPGNSSFTTYNFSGKLQQITFEIPFQALYRYLLGIPCEIPASIPIMRNPWIYSE